MTSGEMTTFTSTSGSGFPGDQPATPAPMGSAEADGPSTSPLANRANLLLIGMVIAGIAVVYLLSLREGPQVASAQQKLTEARVDAVLASLASMSQSDTVKSGRAMDVVNTFYYQARERQIAVDRLQFNPFVYVPITPEVPPEAVQTVAETPGVSPEVELEEKALAEVQHLSLQSVLSGQANATAMISNNLLTVGQTIRGWKVTRIDSDQVVLTWRNKEHVLRMPR